MRDDALGAAVAISSALEKELAGESQPRRRTLTGPASPRRSVCAPGSLAFSLYRRPLSRRRYIMWFPSWHRPRTAPSAHPRSKRLRRQATRARQAVPRLQVEQLEERWCPSFTLVTSRTALAGTDSVNWGTFSVPPPPSGIYVANPFTILSTAGRSISVSKTIADSFLVTQQVSAPPYQGNGVWNGNFAVGDW